MEISSPLRYFPLWLADMNTLREWKCLSRTPAKLWRKPSANITSPISRTGSPPPPLPAPSPGGKKICAPPSANDFPAPEARQAVAHGETVGMSPKPSKPRQGRQKTNPRKSLSPHPGLDLSCSFAHGFTVGYFLPSLRDCATILHRASGLAAHPQFAAARPLPVSKKDFRLESTRGQPPFTRPGIVEAALNWSCVTVRQTVSLTISIS